MMHRAAGWMPWENDEVGTMNDEGKQNITVFTSSFIVPTSSFLRV
jgi:hypothetical protein